MLLQVDVYSQQDTTPNQSLHVCLATCSEAPGQLLSVGRKETLALLSSDKAVSRKHGILTLKTTRTELINENDLQAPVLARRPQEIAACEASCDGICAVWTNLGKLGSFVVLEKASKNAPTKSTSQANSDDDATDEDDEMPMSMQQSQTGMPPVSNATKTLIDHPEQVTLHPVAPNESYVLTQLSLTHRNVSNPRVIVQIGKVGSTLVFTRKPFRFMLGSSDKTEYPFLKQLHKIDAHWIQPTAAADDEANPSLTHHVTPARQFTTRQLISWFLRRTFVHPDYLQALLSRHNPKDPLPRKLPPADDGFSFWTHEPTVSWASWTFLVYDQRDQEVAALATAAGAHVVDVYKLGHTIAQQVQAVELMFQEKQIDKSKCFMLSTKSKKKIVQELHGRLKIVAISTKEMAKHLTSEEPTLPDGSVGTSPSPPVPTKEPSKEVTVEKDDEPSEEMRDQQTSSPAQAQANSKSSPVKRKNDFPPSDTTPKKQKGPKPKRDQTPVTTNVSTAGKNIPDTSVDDTQVPMDEEQQHASRSKASRTSPGAQPTTTAAVTGAAAAEVGAAKGHLSFANTATNDPSTTEDADFPMQEDRDDDHQAKRSLEAQSADGWLTVAPRGKERQAYVRSKAEIFQGADTAVDELLDVAPTVRVTGMVVQAQGQPTSHVAAVSSGPNYKAFRKNSVPPPVRARIQFRVHMTQGAEAQEQAATQLEELEEQRRRADALFAGTARSRPGGSSRRR